MPVATLSFNLPEEEHEHNLAVNANKWHDAVYELVTEMRRRVKYEGAGEEVERMYDWMWQYFKDEGIDPWNE